MSPEKTSSSSRQKVIAGALVVILILIVWLGLGLFKGDSTRPPALTAKPMTPGMSATTANAAPNANFQNQLTPQQQAAQPQPSPVSKDMELLKLQQETQAKYIAALNELQMLKIQRDIGETTQAIAQAKLATVKAEKGINDLLVPTVATPPPTAAIPPGAYAAQMGGRPVQPAPSASPSPGGETATYVVISVSFQLGRWSAVIGSQGKLYNVSVGDVIPPEGVVVANIDRDGVLLSKDGKRVRIRLMSAI